MNPPARADRRAVLLRLAKLLGEWRILIYLVLGFACAIAGVLWYTSNLQEELVRSSTHHSAQLYSQALADFRTLYTSEVVAVARSSGLAVTHDYQGKPRTIPLPATLSMLLGERLGERLGGARTRLYSPYPFPWRAAEGGLHDDFGQAAWLALNQQPDQAYSRIVGRDGRLMLRYASADRMREACVGCHNSHPASPKRDWQVGDVRGILEVELPLDNALVQVRDNMHGTFWLLSSLALLGSISIGWVITSLKRLSHELQIRVDERTRELRETQSELVASAHQAGMAEVASNVLHNVGNVLNSVNISADLVDRRVRASKAQGLAKAVQLINEHAADLGDFLSRDEKGKLLPGYLNQLVAALAAEQQGIAEELGQLHKSVDHIKEIVATQQSYAGASSIVEPLRVTDLLEDALRIHAGALGRHQVSVVKEYAELPPLLLDKHRLLLILVNLISNAKYAMSTADDRSRTMTLSVQLLDEHTLRICVKDEGEGIAPENLTRIFAHGFTTRQGGHGFGLHSCALAAKAMEGRLTAHSDGPGQGAVFSLDLPFKPAEAGL